MARTHVTRTHTHTHTHTHARARARTQCKALRNFISLTYRIHIEENESAATDVFKKYTSIKNKFKKFCRLSAKKHCTTLKIERFLEHHHHENKRHLFTIRTGKKKGAQITFFFIL